MNALLLHKDELETLAALAAVILFISHVVGKAWYSLAHFSLPREYHVIAFEIVAFVLLALAIAWVMRSKPPEKVSTLDTAVIAFAFAGLVVRLLGRFKMPSSGKARA